MYFQYDTLVLDILKRKDKRLGELIDQIGPIQREMNSNLFESLISSIKLITLRALSCQQRDVGLVTVAAVFLLSGQLGHQP